MDRLKALSLLPINEAEHMGDSNLSPLPHSAFKNLIILGKQAAISP